MHPGSCIHCIVGSCSLIRCIQTTSHLSVGIKLARQSVVMGRCAVFFPHRSSTPTWVFLSPLPSCSFVVHFVFHPSFSRRISPLLTLKLIPVPQIVVMDRGVVSFANKIQRAEAAGAVAVIICQNCDVWPYTMTDSKNEAKDLKIPAIMIRKEHGKR